MRCRVDLDNECGPFIADFLGWSICNRAVFGMYRVGDRRPECCPGQFITPIPDEVPKSITGWQTGTPPNDGWYFVTVDFQDLKRPREVGYALWSGSWSTSGVIAWMPEPEPYKGE